MIEYELRKLEIDVADIKSKLVKLGATHVADRQYKRHVFDVNPKKDGTWVRLRTDGTQTTLTVKEIVEDSVDGTHEWETQVDDFDETFKILEKMGLKSKGYQENKRTEYDIDGVQVCIDEWPKIPPHLEIEAASEEQVISTASKLGFERAELSALNIQDIYLEYGFDLKTFREIRF